METKKFWGTFIGMIIGYALSKLYLISAVLAADTGHRIAGNVSIEGNYFFLAAIHNSTLFTVVLISIFSVLGYAFIVTINPRKVDEKETPLQQ